MKGVKVKQNAVAPELKGRKLKKVIRPFPRVLRQCIGLVGV